MSTRQLTAYETVRAEGIAVATRIRDLRANLARREQFEALLSRLGEDHPASGKLHVELSQLSERNWVLARLSEAEALLVVLGEAEAVANELESSSRPVTLIDPSVRA